MNNTNKILYWAGIVSIPLSILIWFTAPNISGNFDAVTDAGMKAAFMRLHADLWGVFVGLWPATLLILSKFYKEN
jgi:hypothetical protein